MGRVLGLDLAAKPSRPSGYAVLTLKLEMVAHGLLRLDSEILDLARQSRVSLVAVDAPLSKPKSGGFRDCERLMLRDGLRVYPVGVRWMRLLTNRAIKLVERLGRANVPVIETHPSSSLRACGFKGDLRSREDVCRFIREVWGVEVEGLSRHELDAVVAAIAGVCFLLGKSKVYSGSECSIILASIL